MKISPARLITTPHGGELCIDVTNTGRPGFFGAIATVMAFKDNAYFQLAGARYPLFWVGRGGGAVLHKGETAQLLLAESTKLTIQNDETVMALIGCGPDLRLAAMFNDLTAHWTLEIRIYRHRWRWIDRKIVTEQIFPERFQCHESSLRWTPSRSPSIIRLDR